MAKELKTIISFGGKMDPSLNRALKASQSSATKASQKISSKLKNDSSSASASMTGHFKKVAGTIMGIYTAIKAAGKLKQFAQDSITAAKAQIEAETKLEQVLKNVKSIQIRGPNAAEAAADHLKEVASSIQEKGVIGDEVSLAGMQQLATFQLDDDVIATLSGGMTDLLAQQKGMNATQQDAVSIGNMVGKVMTGQTSALKRVGISFSSAQEKALKMGTAQEKAAVLAEVLKQNVGGVNKALAETDQGKIQQAENTIGDMQEQVGMRLLPLLASLSSTFLPLITVGFDKILAVLDMIAPHAQALISQMGSGIGAFLTAIQTLGAAVGPTLVSIGKTYMPIISGAIQKIISSATSVFNFISSNWSQIGPIARAIGIAIVGIKILQFANGIRVATVALMAMKKAKMLDKVETLALNALYAKDAIVKGASTAATFAHTAATTAWNVVAGVATTVTTALGAAMAFLTSPIGIALIAITAIIAVIVLLVRNFNKVRAAVASFGARCIAIVTSLQARFPAAFGVINAIIGTFANIVRTKIAQVKSIFSGLKTFITTVGSVFVSVFRKIGSAVSTVAGVISGFTSKVGGAISKVGNLLSKVPGLNKIKLPKFATGGTVTSPTYAMVGEGGSPETIIPHTNTPRSRALLQEAARGVGVKGTGNSTKQNIIFSPTIYAQDSSIKETLEEQFQKFKAFMEQYQDETEREVFA